jgi:REP element-mobilizing transposase RayT
MPRRARVEEIGFYHIINRGVERRYIFMDDNDHNMLITIIDDSAERYSFIMHSFCLMDNHYHFLIETTSKNLSLLMRQINSKYSIYFNKKYNRVGPLWQGRFKSWFVYDESYLFSVIKYIELNPVKAGITQKVGDFKYASSFILKNKITFMQCLNLSLLIDLNKAVGLLGETETIFNDKDKTFISNTFKARFKKENSTSIRTKALPLSQYVLLNCDKTTRNKNIIKAVFDGYKQSELASYLDVSNVLISKIVRQRQIKVRLFDTLKDRGLFWSYSKTLSYEQLGDIALCEALLKYADFDDLSIAFKLFGKKTMRQIWMEKVIDDKRFIRLNVFIGRVFFSMNIESDFFKDIKNARTEKLRLLAG